MSAETIVFSGLSSSVEVTTLVGTRIYPDVAAQGSSLPLIVYERRASEIITTIHDGYPIATKSTMVVSSWADTKLAAETIAENAQIALRTMATSVDRYGNYDEDTGSHAAVVEFEVWEI